MRSYTASLKDGTPLGPLLGGLVRRSWRGWRGYLLAVVSVAACVGLRYLLEPFGQFYYLPMVPAAVATALLTRPGPTGLAIALSIALNLWLVPREHLIDAIVNAALFLCVCWFLAEICWAQRRARLRSRVLARTLAGSTAMLDTVLSAVPVVLLDRKGRVRRLTPAAAGLFELEDAEARGLPFDRLVDGFDLACFAGDGRRPAPASVWTARTRAGRQLTLNLQVGISAGPVGSGYAAVCVTDVTSTEAATTRARELDEQLNRVWRLNSLGQMAATLAHELNQPLSAAAAYMQASQRDIERSGPLGQSAGHTLELAKGQVLRAGAIIRRMRDLLATGTADLRPERVSSMIVDLGPSLQMLGRDQGMEVRVEVDPQDDRVLAERIQFQQAVINLVRNGLEAAAAAAPPLVLISGQAEKAHYVVSVEDNGPGVPPERIEAVLEPTTTTKAGGMGLGLSVTRTIIEGHGGQLEVGRSRYGGAAFTIRIPREEGTA